MLLVPFLGRSAVGMDHGFQRRPCLCTLARTDLSSGSLNANTRSKQQSITMPTALPCERSAAAPALESVQTQALRQADSCALGLVIISAPSRALPWGFTCSTWRMSWLEAADRGTSCTPWHRGPPFLVASGALRRISQRTAPGRKRGRPKSAPARRGWESGGDVRRLREVRCVGLDGIVRGRQLVLHAGLLLGAVFLAWRAHDPPFSGSGGT